MSKKHILLIIVVVAILSALAGLRVFGEAPRTDRPAFARTELGITRADGKRFVYHLEIARTAEEQAYGLMFIKHLSPDAGMMFPYDPPRPVIFWMKNTFIPLDMLFIRADRTIGRIVSNARPLDVTPIESQVEAAAVIEIKGGTAQENGFAVGDRVDSSLLP